MMEDRPLNNDDNLLIKIHSDVRSLIFGYLEEKDFFSLMLSCKGLYDLISDNPPSYWHSMTLEVSQNHDRHYRDPLFGIKLRRFSKVTSLYLPDYLKLSFEEIISRWPNIQLIHFGPQWICNSKWIKFAISNLKNTLRDIRIHKIDEDYLRLLVDCPNLETIRMDFCLTISMVSVPFSLLLQCPKLQRIELTIRTDRSRSPIEWNDYEEIFRVCRNMKTASCNAHSDKIRILEGSEIIEDLTFNFHEEFDFKSLKNLKRLTLEGPFTSNTYGNVKLPSQLKSLTFPGLYYMNQYFVDWIKSILRECTSLEILNLRSRYGFSGRESVSQIIQFAKEKGTQVFY